MIKSTINWTDPHIMNWKGWFYFIDKDTSMTKYVVLNASPITHDPIIAKLNPSTDLVL